MVVQSREDQPLACVPSAGLSENCGCSKCRPKEMIRSGFRRRSTSGDLKLLRAVSFGLSNSQLVVASCHS